MSARGGVIQFRVSVEERAKIDVNAREAGLPLSVFVRARALGAVSEPLSDASTAARQSVHGDGLSAHEPAVPGPASPRAPGDKRAVIEGLRGQVAGVTGEGMDLVPGAVSGSAVARWPPPEPVD